MRIEVVDETSDGGGWAGPTASPPAPATVTAVPDELVLENAFVSSVGWVKPGERLAFSVRWSNPKATPRRRRHRDRAGARRYDAVATPAWDRRHDPGRGRGRPRRRPQVFEAKADTPGRTPRSSGRTSRPPRRSATGADRPTQPRPQGHPADGDFETARYGDRPFPVVPVDYTDRAHEAGPTGERSGDKINDPGVAGSTFNLYQEMSYGQLFPHGTCPRPGSPPRPGATARLPVHAERALEPDTCHGATFADAAGRRLRALARADPATAGTSCPARPSTTATTPPARPLGSVAGVGALQDIDSACGPTGKAVYDAAQIADPEIDYSDFDTDKDGVVDFFMMVFAGLGGNGASQTQRRRRTTTSGRTPRASSSPTPTPTA